MDKDERKWKMGAFLAFRNSEMVTGKCWTHLNFNGPGDTFFVLFCFVFFRVVLLNMTSLKCEVMQSCMYNPIKSSFDKQSIVQT